MKTRIIIGLILCFATFILMQQLPGNISVLLRLSVGNEKILGNQSISQASLRVNIDFNDLATSSVNYTLDNEANSTNFSNNVSSVGVKQAYFLRPLVK